MLAISRHTTRLAEQHAALNDRGGMTTNGCLLTPGLAPKRAECGVQSYQISLDGWGSAHGQTRRRADGAGTFERSWRDLLALRSTDLSLEVTVRIHLPPHSQDSVRTLVSRLAEEFAADLRFTPFLEVVGDWAVPTVVDSRRSTSKTQEP